MNMKESGMLVREIELVNTRFILRFPTVSDLKLLSTWWETCPAAQLYLDRKHTFLTRSDYYACRNAPVPRIEFGETATDKSPSTIPLMILAGNEERVGVVILHKINWKTKEAETRTFIAEDYRDLEYGTDAKMLLIRFAVMELGLETIHTFTRADQPAVHRFNLKCGMKLVDRIEIERNNEIIKLFRFRLTAVDFPRAWANYENQRPHRHSSWRIHKHERSLEKK